MELTFATLMRAPRRARRDVRACGARGAHLGRQAHLPLSAAARGALPRRHQAHRPRRRLLAQHAEGEGPPDHPPDDCATSPAPRPTTTRRSCVRFPEARARRAAVRRRACRSSRAPTMRPRPFDETTLDAARLRRLQGRTLRGRPLHRVRAGQGLVGRRPAGRARPDTISTSCATSTIATATSPSKASPARTTCSARSSPRASGRRATSSRRSGTAASSASMLPDDTPSGAQGWFINTRRDEVQGPAAARGADPAPSISNGPTRPSCTARTTAPIRCSRTPT